MRLAGLRIEAVGQHAAGNCPLQELIALEKVACPGHGACGGQFTANTMALATSFLGLAPMGFNDIPAPDPAKHEVAHACGLRVMELVREGISARTFVTPESVRNAVVAATATTVSSFSPLHAGRKSRTSCRTASSWPTPIAAPSCLWWMA